MKKYLPPSCILSFLHVTLKWPQIRKEIEIIDNDNPSKYKMLLNSRFIC